MRCTALLALALAAAPASADVFIWGQPGAYTSLQAAIDAAVDGDVLLLEPVFGAASAYKSSVVDGKGLHLVGLGTGPLSGAWINGSLEVRNLPASSVFTLSDVEVGFAVQAQPVQSQVNALRLQDCAGQVRVQRCYLIGDGYWDGSFTSAVGAGLRAQGCPRVTVAHSELRGGNQGYVAGNPPLNGGPGLDSLDSAVALFDCLVQGGGGSNESFPTGGFGGPGAKVQGFGLYAAGSTIRGGGGGGGDYIGCTLGGDGGAGLVATNAQVQVLATTVTGGPGNSFGICGPGGPGQDTVLVNAALIQHPGNARDLSGPGLVDDRSPLTFTIEGDPGDLVWVVRGRAPTFQFAPSALGVLLVPKPWLLPLAPMGVIGGGGSLDVTLWTADFTGSAVGYVLYAQALVVGQGGALRLTGPLQVLVRNT